MGDVHDLTKPVHPVEQEPTTLEDALEIISSLRAVVDELSDQIETLQAKREQSADPIRNRLVEIILPKMIEFYRGDIGRDGGSYACVLIAGEAVKLADAVLKEMGCPVAI